MRSLILAAALVAVAGSAQAQSPIGRGNPYSPNYSTTQDYNAPSYTQQQPTYQQPVYSQPQTYPTYLPQQSNPYGIR